MPTHISRRACLGSVSLAATLGAARSFGAQPTAAPTPAPDSFPAQDLAIVRDIVGASHGNLDRVTALLKDAPRLANATYDWGFGDWETAIGAASHTGRKEIAELLLAHGARPDIFAFAMLGNLGAVKAMIEARPGLQRTRGPHGITLLQHARAGGDGNTAMVEFLTSLDDADIGYENKPLSDADRDACIGEYSYGPRDDQRFKVFIPDRQTRLSIQRAGGAPRSLFHQGGAVFHPAGAPEVLVTFTVEGGRAAAVTITTPAPLITARRT